MYYNTTNEKQISLDFYKRINDRQDDKILRTMRLLMSATPSKLYTLFNYVYPLTSIRRSMTNLTKRGKLKKTGNRCVGIYGRNEHVWSVVS